MTLHATYWVQQDRERDKQSLHSAHAVEMAKLQRARYFLLHCLQKSVELTAWNKSKHRLDTKIFSKQTQHFYYIPFSTENLRKTYINLVNVTIRYITYI